MPKKRRRKTVWVVMHYEIMSGPTVDSVQFHVSSTLVAAERYISNVFVDAHSWWQVHPHVVDHDQFVDGDEGDETYFYNYRGKRLQKAPVARAIKLYQKRSRERGEI